MSGLTVHWSYKRFDLSVHTGPTSALTAIYKELSEETPSDLIAKELWCASTNAHEFYTMTQTFTRSNAVMSIIGYILGLGDRHLDNILLDLNTGEIIHVDYNVCFEKGRQLRVAENVPFRLTNNVVNAFGITGIEGVFRISCEKVLKVLRQERETLLTLLDAFVQDPLVRLALCVRVNVISIVLNNDVLN